MNLRVAFVLLGVVGVVCAILFPPLIEVRSSYVLHRSHNSIDLGGPGGRIDLHETIIQALPVGRIAASERLDGQEVERQKKRYERHLYWVRYDIDVSRLLGECALIIAVVAFALAVSPRTRATESRPPSTVP